MQTMALNPICELAQSDPCRDDAMALVLKFVAIGSILIAGAAGVFIPLIGRSCQFLRPDGNLFFAAKAFAAGVILATGFVHLLSGGSKALSNPCLPENPWSKFPFPGFFAMMAALFTLLADFLVTRYYETKQGEMLRSAASLGGGGSRFVISESDLEIRSGLLESSFLSGRVIGEEEGGGMHIVGMRAHAAHHSHGSLPGSGGSLAKRSGGRGGDAHSHGHGDDDVDSGVRHVVVSQILELGIISHSTIIGISVGVSQSPCTIRPLIAALSFHQFFEGFALGGCISQARYTARASAMMACFFAVTAPIGTAMGTAVSSWYDPCSVGALVAEGVLDSLSAGILVYIALVDLIAADFLSKKVSCDLRLQAVSYCLLFLGAGLMSALAVWV